jgi:amino acid transporter/mannitol/fructose-specific phosphotransferase system IIA component (Ntr-type)
MRLRKELKLLDVYAIATSTTLSAGFFLLPAIATANAGSAMVLSYIIAVIPLIPAMFSILELATAMPKAGGMYFSLDRTLGPIFGTIGGFGTWISLILKTAFALVGLGVYVMIYFPGFDIKPIAVIIAIVLSIVSILGVKKGGRLQIILLIILLCILALFIGQGLLYTGVNHFQPFVFELTPIMSTAGMVYVSYVGVAKVVSLSEEIKNPERNLPLGVFLAIFTTITIYGFGTYLMLKIVPMNELTNTLAPVADTARYLMGEPGVLIITIGAIIAFLSVANAGTMSSSRYPLAMSRDALMPSIFKRINKFGTPTTAIILTTTIIIMVLLFLDVSKIAKLASAFQLLLNGFLCIGVIVMRESKIESYDPGFKSPLYPYMQIFGALVSFWIIWQMGDFAIISCMILMVCGFLWYWYYARNKVVRNGAIYHLFERLGRESYKGLDIELRAILKEKGLRHDDPFDNIVANSEVIDIEEKKTYEEIINIVARTFSQSLDLTFEEIKNHFIDSDSLGITPVIKGVALPHFRTIYTNYSHLLLLRAKRGVLVSNELDSSLTKNKVNAFFFLISPENNPTQHLRILAQIASRIDEDSFKNEWLSAVNEQDLKEILLSDDSYISLTLAKGKKCELLINSRLKDVRIPEGCLVAMLQREGKTLIPNGNTIFNEGDRLTILGDKKALFECKNQYIREIK